MPGCSACRSSWRTSSSPGLLSSAWSPPLSEAPAHHRIRAMLQTWVVAVVSAGYLALLFAVAFYADRRAGTGRSLIDSGTIYALSLAVYATSWTYYGSVGRAATSGVGFLPIYLGADPHVRAGLGGPAQDHLAACCGPAARARGRPGHLCARITGSSRPAGARTARVHRRAERGYRNDHCRNDRARRDGVELARPAAAAARPVPAGTPT